MPREKPRKNHFLNLMELIQGPAKMNRELLVWRFTSIVIIFFNLLSFLDQEELDNFDIYVFPYNQGC
jgi:hypothetical protein